MTNLITLGPHNINAATGHGKDWARRAGIAKQVDSTDLFLDLPNDVVRVYRKYFSNQNLYANPQDVANAILEGLGGYRHPLLYGEIYNEIGKGGLWAYGALIKAVVPILHANNVKVCGPSWSTGDYGLVDWQFFRSNGWFGLDAISLHCYWGNGGFTLDHARRYNQFWQPDDPRILVTECGRDVVEGGARGWKKDRTPQAYVDELVAYSHLLAIDGALGVVFQEGSTDPQWDAFDTSGLDLTNLFANGGTIEEVDAPNVGPGFNKCKPIIGAFMEDEIYHGNDGPPQTTTSMAIADKGTAVWHKASNLTLCVTPDGRVFGDKRGALGVLVEYVPKN